MEDHRRKSNTIVRVVHTGYKVLKSAKTIIYPVCFINESCYLQGKGISSISSAQEPGPVSLSTVHPRGEFVWELTFIGQEGADGHLLGFLLCGRCTGQLADVDGTTRLCNKERKSVSTLRRLMVLRFGRLGQCCSRDPAPRRRFGLQQAFTIHDSWF